MRQERSGILVLGRVEYGAGNSTEIVAFVRGSQFGRRKDRELFRPEGFGGRRPDCGGIVLGRRSAAIKPPAGDGRSPGRSPASGCVQTHARSSPRAQRAAARRAAYAAHAGRAGAVSQCRRAARGPQSLRRRRGALQGRSRAGVGQISRTAVEHAEDRHGAQQGSAGGQERHHAEAGDAEHRRRHARDRRGRQRLWRPLLHPRLRRPQRRLHRRRARLRRQRPREFLHRAGRNPARAGLVLCRPRHHRRRDQHRHQAGDDRKKLLQHGHRRSAPTRPSASRSTSTR